MFKPGNKRLRLSLHAEVTAIYATDKIQASGNKRSLIPLAGLLSTKYQASTTPTIVL
jgi:hypothetical protein